MPEIELYEILVIGSGEAGKWLTWTMAQAGHRTAVVERRYIGGSCPNIACLPSKNVIRSAKANWFAKHGAEYGIQTGPVSTDMKGVFNRKRKMVEGEVQFHLDRFKATGTDLIKGFRSRFARLRSRIDCPCPDNHPAQFFDRRLLGRGWCLTSAPMRARLPMRVHVSRSGTQSEEED